MKALMRASGFIALALISVLVSAQTPAVPSDSPDPGAVSGSNYSNKFFGLSLTLPTGWQVQDSGYKKMVKHKGQELVTSDKSHKAELDRAVGSVLNLLAVTQYSPGKKDVFNSSFTCNAEKIPDIIKTDADYMFVLKNTMRYSQVPHTLDSDVHTEEIGGVPFSVVEYHCYMAGVLVKSKYYAHIMKGYAVSFILVYHNDEQLRVESEILDSVVLR